MCRMPFISLVIVGLLGDDVGNAVINIINMTIMFMVIPLVDLQVGGWSEIRTHGDVAATLVFKTSALSHSATHPW